jgi:hypothetical protein
VVRRELNSLGECSTIGLPFLRVNTLATVHQSVFVQLALSMLLLRREFTHRLTFPSHAKLDGTAVASAMVAAE